MPTSTNAMCIGGGTPVDLANRGHSAKTNLVNTNYNHKTKVPKMQSPEILKEACALCDAVVMPPLM